MVWLFWKLVETSTFRGTANSPLIDRLFSKQCNQAGVRNVLKSNGYGEGVSIFDRWDGFGGGDGASR
jgi:hypothetical protein